MKYIWKSIEEKRLGMYVINIEGDHCVHLMLGDGNKPYYIAKVNGSKLGESPQDTHPNLLGYRNTRMTTAFEYKNLQEAVTAVERKLLLYGCDRGDHIVEMIKQQKIINKFIKQQNQKEEIWVN